MHIQAVTYLLAVFVLASLPTASITWQAIGDDPEGGFPAFAQQPYYPGAVEAEDDRLVAVEPLDGSPPLERLVARLLEANMQRAAFRRDSRQPYRPRKPSCEGNSCNERGWKRNWDRRR